MSHSLELALLSCALLGLRHGFDYDHLAAITDITGVQRNWREGMRLGLLYALGHALTVAALGVCVIALHLTIPPGLDRIGERLVGATLIALAVYVAVSWLRHHRAHHLDPAHTAPPPRSRIALLISGIQYLGWRARRLINPTLPRPDSFHFDYSNASVFFVGILHGLGAETPSQLLLFLLAAQLGGTTQGLLGLLCFVVGLLAMNTLMTASAGGVFASSSNLPACKPLPPPSPSPTAPSSARSSSSASPTNSRPRPLTPPPQYPATNHRNKAASAAQFLADIPSAARNPRICLS